MRRFAGWVSINSWKLSQEYISMTSIAPDLENGFITNGRENLWSTEIQCCLKIDRPDGSSSLAALSHECRMERLPFSSTYLGGGEDIFQRDRPWEFLTYTLDGTLYQTGSPTLLTRIPSDYLPDSPPPAFALPDHRSELHCPDREIDLLDFHAAREELLGRNLPLRKLFLRVQWQDGNGIAFTLHTPCRYVNFDNPEEQECAYIQPISGSILYPGPRGLIAGYVACALREDKQIIEFALRSYRDSVEWRIRADRPDTQRAEAMRTTAAAMPSYFLGVDHMTRVEGQACLYRYLPN